MAQYKYNCWEGIVGKRFLCVINNTKLKRNKISEWQWKRGIVRAVTHHDFRNTELNILVEFDDVEWKKREWIRVYEQNSFQLFLLEYTLVWFNNKETSIGKNILWPSLNFKTLIDKIGFQDYKLKPIEFLVDKHLEFVDYTQLSVYQDSDLETQKAYIESPEVRKAIRKWTEFQDSQRILLTTPSVLVGYRIKVYRSEGTTQWYTAVIVSYNENTRELTLTDDTVLEEHNEDPSLVQMKLIGDGVVESILKGEDIGITPRRRTCNQNQTNSYTRNRSGIPSVSGNNCTVNVSTNSTTILTQSTNTTVGSTSSTSSNTICSSHNISPLITRKKSRRNSSDITNKDSKDSPIPSPASTTSSDSRGRVNTTESKNSLNIIRSACETSQRKNQCKETKETAITGDQQILHRNKRSSNQQKHKSESKRETNINNNNTKIRSSYRYHISTISETNPEKFKDSIISSSDTEIEESQKTSHQQKRRNRAKRSRKKCSQSSESDASDPSSHDFGSQTPDSIRGNDANSCSLDIDSNVNLCDVNKVKDTKDSQFNLLNNNTNNDNFNDVFDLKSKTDLVQVSVSSSLTSTCSVISSVKCAPNSHNCTTSSTESTNSTTLTNSIPVTSVSIGSHSTKSDNITVEQKDINLNRVNCNAPQMVPIMCSLDEQLNTSRPIDNKSESFSRPQNVINSEKKVEESNTSKSISNSSVKVNSSSNITNRELNDLKSHNLSLALDRHESVTVYRDPNLANKQIIRHIESLQHVPHGLMHSVTSTTASSLTNATEFARLPPTPQVRTCQPSILPPSSASSVSQYKLKGQAIHSHPPPQSHILSAGSHAHSNPVDPQIYRHLMQTHPMVSGYSAPPIDMLWQQKNYSHLSPMPSSASWGVYNEQMRAQILHHENDKQQQGIRIERERREEKEKQIKIEKESKELIDKERERVRQELIEKEEKAKERKQREAVEQHFEESLRLAHQKKSGWSPISNLPLTKSQTNISRQSHAIPQPQAPHLQQHQSMKSNVSYNSRDYERERLSKEQETERWMAYMHHQQQQQQQQTHSQQSHPQQSHPQQSHPQQPHPQQPHPQQPHPQQSHPQQQHPQQHHTQQHNPHQHNPHHSHMSEALSKHKASEMAHHYQSSVLNGPSSKGGHNIHQNIHQPNTSPLMDASKHHSMTSRAKTEPSFSLYGYQPNHNISYITAAQLKENNRLNISSGVSSIGPIMTSSLPKVPPAAHSMEKRESPKIDRALTPSSRNSTPIGRPPSLSPKQKSPKMMAQERISPLYHRSQTGSIGSIKQCDYSLTNAPPAHQNSSSRSGTPHLTTSAISLQLQSQIPVAHSSSQEQPQNLVKSDTKSKSSYNEITKSQSELHRNSPNATLQSRSSANIPTGYQSYALIQQGLVPNPLYTASATTQSSTNPSSMPSVIAKPQSSKPSNSTLSLSQQSPHLFTRPGPGIVSGIPICRPNSIPYYPEPQSRTPVLAAQKYPQNVTAIKNISNESSTTYQELNRATKLPPHVQYNPTQDRNLSLFHCRPPSSPHSPRISTGSVPPSPYGPAPGMVPVSSSVAHSLATPPAAHSGVHAYNPLTSNAKRKSVDAINSPLNKKQRITESPVTQLPTVKNGENTGNTSNTMTNTDNSNSKLTEVSDDVLKKPIIPSNETIESSSQLSTGSEEFLPKHQKAISIASHGLNTNQINQKLPVEESNAMNTKLANSSTPTVATNSSNNSTTSSFHPKLKKAWLQRHSDEDKIGVVGNNTSNSALNSGNASPAKSTSENTNLNVDNTKDKETKASDAIVNGGINKKDLKEDEDSLDDETSSASEAEVSTASKGGKRKNQSRGVTTRKRIHTLSKEKDSKKRKTDNAKSDESPKIGKENEDKKKKEKNKETEKDSNDLRSTARRGRKPKPKSEEKEKPLKESSSSSSLKKKLQKGKSDRTAIAELKKSGAPFLQGGSCVEVAPKLPKCRECRMTPTQRNRKPTIFCRFYDYRKLAFKSNILTIAGFSQPQDASEEDLKLWLPTEEPPNDLDVETAKFLIAHVGDQFCDLVKQEKEAQMLHMGSSNKNITWKRVVQGVREMCDVCETTLFNIHWVCDKCGFVVCIDCYKARKVGSIKEELCPAKDRDGFQWLLCNNRQQHEPQKLEVTQIIAASALSNVGRMLHTLRTKWNIASNCSCVNLSLKEMAHKKSNGFTKQVLSVVKIENKQLNGMIESSNKNWKSINGTVAIIKQETDSTLTGYSSESGNSPLSFFVDVALTSEKLISKSEVKEENEIKTKKKIIKSEKESELIGEGKDDEDNKHSTLRELLMGPTSKSTKDIKSNGSPISESQTIHNKKANQVTELETSDLDTKDENCIKKEPKELHKELQHFMRRYVPLRKEAEPLPIISRALEETKKLFPQISHNWFCGGKLLVLHDPKNNENINMFQEQWIRGQPVIVKENHKNLSQNLWHPESFSRDFGEVKNDLVNCRNGDTLAKQPMRKFWDGFENLQNRMKDKNGEFILLKLKDWPPDEEFSELLPTRYRDLMNSLPLPEYTSRNGVLNLASRLPDCFVRPDLGPKMYSAYGSTLYPDKGTTNLHLDISDAVNVMIFVGIPKDTKTDKDSLQDVLNAVDSGGCDELMKKRVREKGVKVGALWHIYNARDADKIRDLLNKVAIERGETLEPHHDPIHDQSWYLDEPLRDRLLREYGVEGYAIAQCLGDALFIPAGAPHQVRNLNSCIKVAGDFVSPENVSHCFNLTQEFRQLSDTHTNHEDKLQIKNIIYHAVKDALSCLRNHTQDSN